MENSENFIIGLENALRRITNERYYQTEMGFQGALISELQNELVDCNWEHAIIEQEYQKRISEHGTRVRPDIIVHVPFDSNIHNTREEGNFVVFELKLNATLTEGLSDIKKLSDICTLLNYPLGIFINISGETTFIDEYTDQSNNKIIGYTVNLVAGDVVFSRKDTNA